MSPPPPTGPIEHEAAHDHGTIITIIMITP